MRTFKRIRIQAMVAAVAAVVLVGCDSGSSGGDSDTPVVGAVTGSAANPAVQVKNNAMQERADEAGVTLYVETSESVEEQIEKAETLISRGVDYLGLQPWDGEAVKPLIESAAAQGVKVVILIDGVPDVVEDGTALTFVSGNELAAAEEIGRWVSENDDLSKAAILTGTPGNLSAENRTSGFQAGLEGGDVTVAAASTANWARDEALRVAGDMLTANPDLDVIFGNNDEMAFGALQAATEAGRRDDVTIIGWNGTCVGLEALLKGEFALEAVLPFDEFGAGLIDVALDDAAGRDVPATFEPEVPVLTTEDAQAILAGEQEASEALLARLQEAESGNCG